MYKSVASLLAGGENRAQISISALSDVLKASTRQLAAQLIIFYTFNRIYGTASCSLLYTQHSRLSLVNTSSVLYMAAYFVLNIFFTKLMQEPGEVSFLPLAFHTDGQRAHGDDETQLHLDRQTR